MTEQEQLWLEMSNAALALGGTVAVLAAVVLGMAFVRLVW